MKVFNKKLNDKITLVSVNKELNEIVLSVNGKEHHVTASTFKEVKNNDYVLYSRLDIAKVCEYSQSVWRGEKQCSFRLKYDFSDRYDTNHGFIPLNSPIYIINEYIHMEESYTYDELLVYVKALEDELAQLRNQ